MKNQYTLLRPIKTEILRDAFSTAGLPERPIYPLEIMEPTVRHFEKFAISRFFWFIVDLKNWKNVCGGGAIEIMTPLKTTDFFGGDHQAIHDMTHPVDLHHVNAFSKFWVNLFLSLPPERRPFIKMTMYFRILNAAGEYYWIMVQYSDAVLDSNNMFVYGLVFATDISHLKKDGYPMMTILDTYDNSSQQFFCTEQKELVVNQPHCEITIREREILHYLALGYSSKQIASALDLSIKTIDNHRQNMLHKTQCKSTGELVAFCISSGYL